MEPQGTPQTPQYAQAPAEKHSYLLYIGIGAVIAVIGILFFVFGPMLGISQEVAQDTRTYVEIVSVDSGVTNDVRKEAILRLVSRGPSGLSDEEKAVIASALQGQRVNFYNFTPEEIERIYTVINN